jgi:phospholipid/cholesterol/gamma-HCH transport system substrate-binding protein
MSVFTKLKQSREVKVGITFILAIAVMIWGLMYLKGLEIFKTKRTFFARYETVNGLVSANAISIKGMKVGQVKSLYFSKADPSKIIVELVIENDYPIPDNSVAKIVSTGLIGSKEIEIALGNSKQMLENGDTLIAFTEATLGEEVNRQILPLKKKAENLISSIDTVATIIQELLNKNTRDNLIEAIEHIKEALENLAHTTYNIDTLVSKERNHLASIITNVESITYNLRQNNDKIRNILTNFSEISDSLAAVNIPRVIRNVDQTITDLNLSISKINSGQGSLGMLLNDKQLYDELTKTARDLNLLLEDIKANPSKYIKVSVF